MNHDAKQPPSDDRLARRIIERYGQSPGLISTAAIRRQADRLHRFGIGRLPLLASVQRRYAPAMTYLSGDRSELRYAWPFAAARTLAPAAAIMPTVGRGENGQSGLVTSRPSVAVVGSQPEVSSVHAPGVQSESRPVGSITPNTKGPTFAPAMTASRPPGRKGHLADRTTAGDRGTDIVQRLADPMSWPIRRVNRQAEPKVPIPIIQPARQSASGSTKVGAEMPPVTIEATNPLSPLAERASPTMKIPTNPLSPKGERARERGSFAGGRGGIIFPGNCLNHSIPAITRIQKVPDRPNLGIALVQRHGVEKTGVHRVKIPTNPFSSLGGRARERGSFAGGRGGIIFPGNCLNHSIPAITRIQKVPDRPNLGIVQRHWAATATVQRAAPSDTTSPRPMPLAVMPKAVMMSARDTPPIQAQSTTRERLSSPGGSSIEAAPTAGSVPRRGEAPEYTDELVDQVLRKLKRHLAVESERRGWRQWP